MVVVQLRPSRPMGWLGPIGPRPRRRLQRHTSTWVMFGLLLLALLAGGTAATAAKAPPKPPGLSCATKGGGNLTADQRRNAAVIVGVGQAMHVPPRGVVVALATAMQESTLRNLSGGDRDSAGLFQQRPSQGWGSWSQVTDPKYSAATFYRHLLKVPGWEGMPVTVAAQTVQRSAYPDAYRKHVPVALALAGSTSCERT